MEWRASQENRAMRTRSTSFSVFPTDGKRVSPRNNPAQNTTAPGARRRGTSGPSGHSQRRPGAVLCCQARKEKGVNNSRPIHESNYSSTREGNSRPGCARETGLSSPNPRREDNLGEVEFTGRRSGLTGGNTPGIRGTLPEWLRYFCGEQVTCHQWQLILHVLQPAFHAVYRRHTPRQGKKRNGGNCPDWRQRCLS